MRVVVVDDFEAAADAAVAALQAAGFEAHAAYAGPEAVARCESVRAHVVLMDIAMPGYDGFMTVGLMRRLQFTRDTVIVAYTAMAADYVRERSAPCDFDGYFQKGQPFAALLKLIQKFLQGSAKSR